MIRRVHSYLTSPGLVSIAVNAVAAGIVVNLGGMFFSFLVGMQLARCLGKEGYGTYGLVMSVVALLTILVEFGVPRLLVREVAKAQVAGDWGELRGVFLWANKTALSIAVVVVTITMIGLLIVAQYLHSILSMALFAGLFMIPVVALTNIYTATLRGLQYVVIGQIPDNLVRPALHSALLFLYLFFTLPLNAILAVWLGVLSAIMALVVAMVTLHGVWPKDAYFVPPQIKIKYWWYNSIPMALAEIMRVLQGHLPILFLGIMVIVSVVGTYRVANSMYIVVSFPSILLEVVMAPIIARLYAQGNVAKLQRLLMWMALGMTFGPLVLTIPFTVAGTKLLTLVFGKEFSAANSVLLVLCFGAIINGCFGGNFVLLNMSKHQERVTYASAISLLLLVLILPPLIMVHGAIGAAVASVLSILTWNVLAWYDAWRLLSLDTSILAVFRNFSINTTTPIL